jgi:hypothetical protein
VTSPRGPETLLAVAALLVAGACAVAVVSSRADGAAAGRRSEALRLTGGLGLGATLDLSECAHGLDPRLDDACARRLGPLPGDGVTCPHHRGVLPAP